MKKVQIGDPTIQVGIPLTHKYAVLLAVNATYTQGDFWNYCTIVDNLTEVLKFVDSLKESHDYDTNFKRLAYRANYLRSSSNHEKIKSDLIDYFTKGEVAPRSEIIFFDSYKCLLEQKIFEDKSFPHPTIVFTVNSRENFDGYNSVLVFTAIPEYKTIDIIYSLSTAKVVSFETKEPQRGSDSRREYKIHEKENIDLSHLIVKIDETREDLHRILKGKRKLIKKVLGTCLRENYRDEAETAKNAYTFIAADSHCRTKAYFHYRFPVVREPILPFPR